MNLRFAKPSEEGGEPGVAKDRRARDSIEFHRLDDRQAMGLCEATAVVTLDRKPFFTFGCLARGVTWIQRATPSRVGSSERVGWFWLKVLPVAAQVRPPPVWCRACS